jgi:glycerophosphoryl diester phosphodiesterase
MNLRPLLLGHRGARANKSFIENTFESFGQALVDGCDGFEFDVRLSADCEALVCHDPKIGAVKVAQATGKELANLPRLEEVLKRYRQRVFLDIELKVAGLEKITARLLRQYSSGREFVVSSFLPEVLQEVHAEDPSIPLGLICETKAELVRWRELPLACVIPHQALLRKKLIDEIRDAGKKIFVWTVNHPQKMKRFAEWEVDGIISDDTKLLCQTLI